MAFRPSKSKKHYKQEKGQLNMNSMMDMMTIILLFLLKSYSTSGALVTPSENLKLPTSIRDIRPKKELQVAVARDMILVNEIPLIPTSAIHPDEMSIPQLTAKLMEYAEGEKQLEIDIGKEFTNQVLIQGDEDIDFETLIKVMYTCSKSEFYKMRLVTVKSSSKSYK
jgi:biopolymer transport protein ExbD